MKIFTNTQKNRFFKTDDYVKNLQVLEINSIKELIEDHAVCGFEVVVCEHFMLHVAEFDVLDARSWRGIIKYKIAKGIKQPKLETADILDMDFLKGLSRLEIVRQVTEIHKDSFECLDRLVYLISKQKWDKWENDRDHRGIEVSVINDQLTIALDHKNEKVIAVEYKGNLRQCA